VLDQSRGKKESRSNSNQAKTKDDQRPKTKDESPETISNEDCDLRLRSGND